jgi:hypothetical protein
MYVKSNVCNKNVCNKMSVLKCMNTQYVIMYVIKCL